ncbi:AraC family transcriptional regulator [Coraliomargarita sp. SDUM461004]|uniref:AraC family transcriptional regulator n=1 Tax=Thalassobacterium sedimentorum TaxID=3041258 RepID=A0ABU1AHH9_9BACT|nr:AraC family transcriptional regulator [Coraliomargarita sp. SDUM461004]MDQ8194059.1 AraC family transcriptional regulator [Coraliomargarita sp. SDUM461004]
MNSLKAHCLEHGGKFTRQSGILLGRTRDYWLIFETFHPLPVGYVSRCAQIGRSWGMHRHVDCQQMRELPYYSLVLITDGEGVFYDGSFDRLIPVQAGDLLCLFPGRPHAYAPVKGTSWDEINFEFSGVVFDSWVGAGLLDPSEPVRKLVPDGERALIAEWLKKFHAVAFTLADRKMAEPALADAGRLIALISELCETWQSGNCDADVEWANTAKQQLMKLSAGKKADFAVLAREFGVGEQAYRKKFKRLCGVSPSAFRSRQQIEMACYELISTHKPIKEIGYDLGFGSDYYFSKRFKQVTGVSPGEYRRQAHS